MGRMQDRVFAATWKRMARHEGPALRKLRREALAGASGRVLEIGVGSGSNWPFLPVGIEYTGIEPNPFLLEAARARARERHLTFQIAAADVERLPFEDGSFDTVLSTLTFCSVAHATKGLSEIRRVLKPGGQFLFLEHVRSRNGVAAGAQTLIKPITRSLGGGCEWDRDTLRRIQRAGFTTVVSRRRRMAMLPVELGRAVR